MKLLLKIFGIISLLIWCCVWGIGCATVDKAMFQPPPASYGPSGLTTLSLADGQTVAAKFYANPDADFSVLLCHGNAEDIGHGDPFHRLYQAQGFQVLAVDYPGYGLSPGTPTEASSVAAARAGYDFLVKEKGTDPASIILHGRSIGGGVASQFAVEKPVGAVILESTFVSVVRVVTKVPIIPIDRFRNSKKIGSFDAPVLIIHGTADRLIPQWHAETLFKKAKGMKELYLVEGAGHNDLFPTAGEMYFRKIRAFVEKVEKLPR